MTLRTAVSTLLILAAVGAAAPAAAQTVRTAPERARPAVRAWRQALARPALRRQVHRMTPEQRQALRQEVKALVQQSRQSLRDGSRSRAEIRQARMQLRIAIRQAIRKSFRAF